MKNLVNFYIGNHSKVDGIEDFINNFRYIYTTRGYSFMVSLELNPAAVNIVVDEFTNVYQNHVINEFAKKHYYKLIIIATEFVNKNYFVKSFNNFDGIIQAALIAWCNVILKHKRKDFKSTKITEYIKALIFLPVLIWMPIFYALLCLPILRISIAKYKKILAKKIKSLLYKTIYLHMRYLGFQSIVGNVSSIILAHGMIKDGLLDMVRAEKIIGTFYPECEVDKINKLIIDDKPLMIEITGSVTPFREKILRKTENDIRIFGIGDALIKFQRRKFKSEKKMGAAFSLHPPQSRSWKYSSPTRLYRAIFIDKNLPILTHKFKQHPIEEIGLHYKGQETVINMIKLYNSREELSNYYDEKILKYLKIATDNNDQLVKLLERNMNKIKIAFFIPTPAFYGNFGLLPKRFEELGIEVHWLIGEKNFFMSLNENNKHLIINDMIGQVSGFDAIITASLMDCLPNDCVRVLHDHLSFAHFDMEDVIDKLDQNIGSLHISNKSDMFEKIGAFPPFLPYYDLVLTSSKHVDDITRKALKISGYEEVNMNKMKITIEKKMPWDLFVDKKNYRNAVSIKNTGYLKLESAVINYKGIKPEKLIIYAPSPREYQNNKNNPLWDLALTSKDYGRQMLMKLCIKFHDFRIIYKPYKDEHPEIVKSVTDGMKKYGNFEICDVGSNYWDIYSRSLIMISDFSSTAYTFAVGMSRPVIFFSPNEDLLPANIREGVYCSNRHRVGIVCNSDQKVVEAVFEINNKYNFYVSEIDKFCKDLGQNYKDASNIAAEAILDAIKEKSKK